MQFVYHVNHLFKVYKAMVFISSILTKLSSIPTIDFRSHHPRKKACTCSTLDLLLTHTALHPHFTSPTLRHLLTFFLSLELPALDISVNGVTHLVTLGDWFLSLTLTFSRFSPVACISASFLLLLTKLPLCGYTAFYLCIHQLTGVWVVCVVGYFMRCVAS